MTLKNSVCGIILLTAFLGFTISSASSAAIHSYQSPNRVKSYPSRSYQSQFYKAPSSQHVFRAQQKPSEGKAKKILKSLERKNPKSHFYSRHSASTTLNQQKRRAQWGITPDGQLQRPMNGARWLNHKDQLYYYNKAKKIHLRTGQRVVDLSSPHYIGEGYLKGGRKYTKTKRARFVFHNGRIVTAFPILR